MREIILPTVHGMAKDGIIFTGFLYAGLMIDEHGNPKTACQISVAVHTAESGVQWLGAYAFGAGGRLIWEPFEPEEPVMRLN